MDLYLVRHAIAEDRDAMRWPDDADRPLSDKGVDRFERESHGLGMLVPTVDIVELVQSQLFESNVGAAPRP